MTANERRGLVDSEVAALVLGCSIRQVQILVKEGELTNYGARHRLMLDVNEVTDRRMKATPPRRLQPSGGTTD